ncbi:MAG: M10 family metallopeptidase C-terminal domain-containing protein [Pseudomonadota bacterium]
MTTFVPTESVIGPQPIYTSVAVNDGIILLEGLTFISTSANAVNVLHGNQSLLNMTSLISGGGHGVVVNGVSDSSIVNTAAGTIGSVAPTIGYSAIYMQGDRNALRNAGLVSADNGVGVTASGDNVVIENSGRIFGFTTGMLVTGQDYSIVNSGRIEAGNGATPVAVYLAGTGAGKYLVNTGTIQALAAEGGLAVQIAGQNLTTLDNAGIIRSVGGVAIDASSATGGIHLTNSGSIISSTAFTLSVVGTALSDTIFNSGSINRSVAMGDGADLFDGIGGLVGGTVLGGDGNDTYRLSDSLAQVFEDIGQGTADLIEATVSFSLMGAGEVENLSLLGTAQDGTGNGLDNILAGNDSDNRLYGLAGADDLAGGGGDDLLNGGASNDSLAGGGGDDRLAGRTGADSLLGQDGDDLLIGGDGTDTLRGDEGEDALIGGAGRDNLYGGAEADSFVFRSIAESGTSAALRDTIFDFEAGVDQITLAAIDALAGTAGNQAFTWLGTGAFTGAAGQVRYSVTGTTIILEGTVTADTMADFQIRVMNLTVLAVEDLIL